MYVCKELLYYDIISKVFEKTDSPGFKTIVCPIVKGKLEVTVR